MFLTMSSSNYAKVYIVSCIVFVILTVPYSKCKSWSNIWKQKRKNICATGRNKGWHKSRLTRVPPKYFRFERQYASCGIFRSVKTIAYGLAQANQTSPSLKIGKGLSSVYQSRTETEKGEQPIARTTMSFCINKVGVNMHLKLLIFLFLLCTLSTGGIIQA